MEKLKIQYPVIVEGKYDKIRLSGVMEGQILTTEGFGIFNHKEKLALFRALAEKSPVILLTDSDGAGKLIRSHLTSAIPKERIIQLYVPKIKGKERRKNVPSAEGTLGVEGMEDALLYNLLAPYERGEAFAAGRENPLSKTDFFLDGLTGKPQSGARRDALALSLGLPTGMTPNALLSALQMLLTYEEYKNAVAKLPREETSSKN